MSADLRQELAGLVAAIGQHLRWLQGAGVRWVPGGASPRSGVAVAADPEPVEPVEPVEPASAAAAPERVEPPAPGGTPGELLAAVRDDLGECTRCRLAEGRRKLVFGVGSASADLMFIGEAPGAEEDRQGEPFVGAAGQLLTKMIKAMGLDRNEVYIANIIKCRPPKNRDPQPDEVETCEPFLVRQIEAIAPRIIISLGNYATKTLLRTDTGITRIRGKWHAYHGVPLMPTFHPAYLLRNPGGKRPAWNDLQQVMAEMDRLGIARPGDASGR